MRNSDLKSRFIDRWCGVFAQLLDAQIHGSPLPVVAKLRRRYQNLARIAGEEVTQDFFYEAISRVGEVSPEAAERLLRNLSASGVLRKGAARGEA